MVEKMEIQKVPMKEVQKVDMIRVDGVINREDVRKIDGDAVGSTEGKEEGITVVGLTDCIKVGLKLGLFEEEDDGLNDGKEIELTLGEFEGETD